MNNYIGEPEEQQRWCSLCEHWDEDCRCPSPDDEPLDRTEATTDWYDHNFNSTDADVRELPAASGASFPTAQQQQSYWESDAFLIGHNGEQPHED